MEYTLFLEVEGLRGLSERKACVRLSLEGATHQREDLQVGTMVISIDDLSLQS